MQFEAQRRCSSSAHGLWAAKRFARSLPQNPHGSEHRSPTPASLICTSEWFRRLYRLPLTDSSPAPATPAALRAAPAKAQDQGTPNTPQAVPGASAPAGMPAPPVPSPQRYQKPTPRSGVLLQISSLRAGLIPSVLQETAEEFCYLRHPDQKTQGRTDLYNKVHFYLLLCKFCFPIWCTYLSQYQWNKMETQALSLAWLLYRSAPSLSF